jgi:hypothetical protein
LALLLLALGWASVLVGVMAVSDAAPAALVLFPSAAFLAELPSDAVILSATPFSITLASGDAELARGLYSQGAWLVLPSGLTGCSVKL